MIAKLPPQSIDLEKAVLGACLFNSDGISRVKDILSEESFYKNEHMFIYAAILNLFKASKTIDIITITQELIRIGKLKEIGGAFYISSLTTNLASGENIEVHARLLAEIALKRDLIRIGTKMIQNAYSETTDVFDLIENNIQTLFELVNFKTNNKVKHISSINKSTINVMREVLYSNKSSGIPSGINYLDKLTNGWQKSDLIILAARPGMGKTAVALQFIKDPSLNHNIPTAFFSLEMSSTQIMGRLQSSESFINVSKIITNNLNDDEINAIERDCAKLAACPIYIDDTPALSLFTFRQKAKQLVINKKVELIVVDYLQLMTAETKGGNREQEISTISRGLKQTAKELDIPIIALSQLSRSVESRGGDRKPQLSDLRESGAIEQDADMIIFGYRPEYYNLMDDYEYYNHRLSAKELFIGIIAKHRNGALGEIPIRFKGMFMKIDNLRIDSEPEKAPF